MIELVNIHKSFGPKKVLDGVSFICPTAKTTVVIGPSGSGKSTILRLILRLIDPEEGELNIDGENILTYGTHELETLRTRIGMVFQRSALFDSKTIWENVGFALLEHEKMPADEVKQIAIEKLKLVGLEGAEDRYPAELSGGMQKRVSFARAIARNPDYILYDEPTTGLDPITSTIIEDLIKSLQAQTGATSIVVTHQLSTIFRTADVITMLYEGKMIITDTPEAIRQSTNPIVRNFIEGKIPEGENA